AYHGALVVVSRLVTGWTRVAEGPSPISVVTPFQVAGMFALTCVGWLMFRETEISMLLRDLSLRPWDTTDADRAIGAYLFLLTLVYSLPLWVNSIWTVYVRPAPATRGALPADGPLTFAGRTALAGAAFATILVFRSRQSLDFIYFQF